MVFLMLEQLKLLELPRREGFDQLHRHFAR
jgi:hypothetical protein